MAKTTPVADRPAQPGDVSVDQLIRQEIAIVLQELEHELQRIERWESAMPSPERLASEVPFCHDTLEFTQWVQWIFIPRFRAVLEGGHELPQACAIAPVAELALDQLAADTSRLLERLREVDRLVTERTPAGRLGPN